MLRMFCCCLPFRRRGRKARRDESFFDDDFYSQQHGSIQAPTSNCDCHRLGRANSGCDYATPTSAAALMRDQVRQNTNYDGHILPASLRNKPPSSEALSYVTAPDGASDSSSGGDDDSGDIDFTDDDETFVDAASQGSIDAAEASNIAITDKKEFFTTVCDSPVKYQDRFGRSQSMRRYSSAIADRIAAAAAGQSPAAYDDDDNSHELDSEPLELSRNQTDDTTQFSATILEAGPSSTTIGSVAAAGEIDKFGYVDELRERLPEIRDGLRHVVPSDSATFPKFNGAADIGRFLAADGSQKPLASARAQSAVQSKRPRRGGGDDGRCARRQRANSEPRESFRFVD